MQSVDQAQATHSLPTLRLDSKGDDVKYLQVILNFYGYDLKVDGVFGSKTEAAVKKFQKSRKLTADGIVGRKTWDALLAEYSPGC
jgi:peptidoglycan hydrolase-like protein with peptidoglycan-binding domain